MRLLVVTFIGLILGITGAKAYTVGSYFDLNNQSGYTVTSEGTTVLNTEDLLVEHYEDAAYAFDPKVYYNLIDIYAANTNQFVCEITEKEQIEWAWGDTVDWLEASSDNNNCQVTYWISGEGDQTSHVSTKVVGNFAKDSKGKTARHA